MVLRLFSLKKKSIQLSRSKKYTYSAGLETAECVNSQFKDSFGGSLIRVKGHAKIMHHLMVGLLT